MPLSSPRNINPKGDEKSIISVETPFQRNFNYSIYKSTRNMQYFLRKAMLSSNLGHSMIQDAVFSPKKFSNRKSKKLDCAFQ
jgi:hypothetical protein